ncbi:hypothetical protein D3C86_1985260 [compost metagenome]
MLAAHHIHPQVPHALPRHLDDIAQPGFIGHFKSGLDPMLDDQRDHFVEPGYLRAPGLNL